MEWATFSKLIPMELSSQTFIVLHLILVLSLAQLPTPKALAQFPLCFYPMIFCSARRRMAAFLAPVQCSRSILVVMVFLFCIVLGTATEPNHALDWFCRATPCMGQHEMAEALNGARYLPSIPMAPDLLIYIILLTVEMVVGRRRACSFPEVFCTGQHLRIAVLVVGRFSKLTRTARGLPLC